MRTRLSVLFWVFLGLVVAVFFSAVGFYTDWLWFSHIGYRSVFVTVLLSAVTVGVVAGLVYALFVGVNLWLAQGVIWRLRRMVVGHPLERLLEPGWLKLVIILVSLGVGVLAGIGWSSDWPVVQGYLQATPFGNTDPIFEKDIGFYVFTFPFYLLLYRAAFGLVLLTLLAVGLIYFAGGGISFLGGSIEVQPRAKAHLSGLVAVLFGLKALGYRLQMYGLLYSARGVVFGASYTDVNAKMVALQVLFYLALFLAALLLVNIWLARWRLFLGGVGALFLGSLLLGSVYPALVQQFVVSPNELAKERPYIEYNIKLTRQAYGLDDVEEKAFDPQETLTLEDIQQESATMENIRIWDPRPLQQTYSQLQEIRFYYKFYDVDVDRYVIDGRYRQVMLSARELEQDLLQERSQTWVNQRLKYTHGYGVAMSPTTELSTEGLPIFYLKDIPPVSTVEGIEVERPEIYYGELTDEWVVVKTREPEFDYPIGDANATTTYQGKGGVEIGSILNRVAFTVRLGSYRLLFSGAIGPESRVMLYRTIRERAEKVAPFLTYDSDPYLVINDGRLFWIIDAYTTTSAYPYSEPTRAGFNYIRNSVKVVVDAYHGTLDFYVVDESDPLVATYQKIFPDLFKAFADMPQGLKAHIRYPQFLFEVQADVYNTYHMENPEVFYNKEDQWNIPKEVFAGKRQPVEPYYVIMRIPGEENPEFVLILPFTPVGKDNMIGWMAARSDGDNYGELLVFKFPKQKIVFGPSQIEARIDQDPFISQRLTLWSQKGSDVIRGNLLVIPVDESLLFVEPIYLQATGNQLPELKRVIVAHADRVVMAQTLGEAVAQIFGQAQPEGDEQLRPEEEVLPLSELIERANDLFDQAQQMIQEGDWSGYGATLNELRQALRDLRERYRETVPHEGQGTESPSQ